MYKKICTVLLAFLLMFMLNTDGESAKAFEEGYFTVGSIFSLNRPDTIYSVDDTNIAELVEKEPGIYAVRCIKPGDVYITAITKLQGGLVKFVMLAHISESEMELSENNDDINDSFIEEVVYLVNVERSKVGAENLLITPDLMRAAGIRAEELSEHYSHTRPDGSSCFTAVKGQYRHLGENIAAGYQSPSEVVEGWMESEGHRENILNPAFTKIGVGYHYTGTDMVHYWVQMFGQ